MIRVMCIQGIWKCKGVESGTVFSEVDLTEGEWTDYDEKVGDFESWFCCFALYRSFIHIVFITGSGSSERDERHWTMGTGTSMIG